MNAVRLRPVKETDLPIFFVYQRDPEALFLSGLIPRDHDAFMQHWRALLVNPRVLQKCGFRPSSELDEPSAGESVKRLMFELHAPSSGTEV